MKISNIAGVIFDLDGTIYLGEAALPGAVEAVQALRQQGKRVLFVSNKPLDPPDKYAQKLTRLGIPAAPADVITSAGVLGTYLAERHPELNYYVLGEDNLKTELRQAGLKLVGELEDQSPLDVISPSGIDAVVVAFDRTLDYRKLNTAYQALVHGARFFATNADKVCPMPEGAIPDAGGTIAALEHITGRRLELVAGKPSPIIMQVACRRMGLEASQCLMVGDRLETDIRMGLEAGMTTGVVLTGVTHREDLDTAAYRPHLVLENAGRLLDYFE